MRNPIHVDFNSVAVARVVAVAVDDLTAERLKSSVRGTEIAATLLSAEAALEHARAVTVPTVFLVEWSEEHEARATALCGALRALAGADRCSIIALGGVGKQNIVLRALSCGADAVLPRPFGDEALIAKVRSALVALQVGRGDAGPTQEILTEALENPHGGEVVIRAGQVVGRIHVQKGHIVWAHISSVPASIEDVLAHAQVTLEPDLIAAVKEECRRSASHFMEVLTIWGVVTREQAKEAVRQFVTERLKLILALPGAVALFLPKSVPYNVGASHASYSADLPNLGRRGTVPEVRSMPTSTSSLWPQSGEVDPGPTSSVWRPDSTWLEPKNVDAAMVPDAAQLKTLMDRATKVDGAVGACAVDRKTGEVLARTGTDMEAETLKSLVNTFGQLGPKTDELLASSDGQLLVARVVQWLPSHILIMALSSQQVSLGLGRAMVVRLCLDAGVEAAPTTEKSQS